MLKLDKDAWGAVVGLLLIVFVASVNGAYSQQSIPNNQTQPATSNQQENGASEVTAPPRSAQHKQGGDQERYWYTTFIEQTPEWVIAVLTLILAASTIGLWKATGDIANDAADGRQRTERAYVTISHVKGIRGISDDEIEVSFEIRNRGRSPARVTDVVVEWFQGPLHIDPTLEVRERAKPAGFLVADGNFFHTARYAVSKTDRDKMYRGEIFPWMYGYVDYTDMFGVRHRAGYGRQYNRFAGDFVFIANALYNYDRPRRSGEGDDWNET